MRQGPCHSSVWKSRGVVPRFGDTFPVWSGRGLVETGDGGGLVSRGRVNAFRGPITKEREGEGEGRSRCKPVHRFAKYTTYAECTLAIVEASCFPPTQKHAPG